MITLMSFLTFISMVTSNNIRYASVTYNVRTQKFMLHDFISVNAVAFASFQDEIFSTGWSYLEVKTKEFYPDPIQAYAAGLVEGYLTVNLINKHWYNILSDYCDGEEPFCGRLNAFLQQNMDFVNENIKKKRNYDFYWHQVALTLEQLKGMEDGFRNTSSGPSTEVDVMGLLLINIMGDLLDLEIVLHRNQTRAYGSGLCSGLVKVLPGLKDLYFAHDTWFYYNTMLKMLKKYSFMFHTSMHEDSPVVPGHTWSFSSQPGMIYSAEDFYLISTGLAVMETSLTITNDSLWQYVKAEGVVLEWQRTIVANRLAKNGGEWAKFFGKMNSGTYNNQWTILNYNKFTSGKPLQDGLLWTLEQLPGHLHSGDMTDMLRKQNYWASYNIAYYSDIFNLSGGEEDIRKYGNSVSYAGAPRALIFKRDQGKVTDIDSMTKLMRYNDFKNDPLSQCNCTPAYEAYYAISSRCDLNLPNGTYPYPGFGHKQYGGLDMKLTSYKLFRGFEFVAVAGPTYDPLPPFQWSKSDFDKTVKHEGHPDLWKFKPIIHKWM